MKKGQTRTVLLIVLAVLTLIALVCIVLVNEVSAEPEEPADFGRVWIIKMEGRYRLNEDGYIKSGWLHFVMGVPEENNPLCEQGTPQAVVSIKFHPEEQPLWYHEVAYNEGCGPVDLMAMDLFASSLIMVLKTGEYSLPPAPLGPMGGWSGVIEASEEYIEHFYAWIWPRYLRDSYLPFIVSKS